MPEIPRGCMGSGGGAPKAAVNGEVAAVQSARVGLADGSCDCVNISGTCAAPASESTTPSSSATPELYMNFGEKTVGCIDGPGYSLPSNDNTGEHGATDSRCR
jgi:hypothetical protein